MPFLGVHADDVWVEADYSTRSGLYCDVQGELPVPGARQDGSKRCAGFECMASCRIGRASLGPGSNGGERRDGVGRLIVDDDVMHCVAWRRRRRCPDQGVSGE